MKETLTEKGNEESKWREIGSGPGKEEGKEEMMQGEDLRRESGRSGRTNLMVLEALRAVFWALFCLCLSAYPPFILFLCLLSLTVCLFLSNLISCCLLTIFYICLLSCFLIYSFISRSACLSICFSSSLSTCLTASLSSPSHCFLSSSYHCSFVLF